MLVMSYLRNLSIKLYRIYVCYTNITLYDVMYSVRYYPRFHVTDIGFGTLLPADRGFTCITFAVKKKTISQKVNHVLVLR